MFMKAVVIVAGILMRRPGVLASAEPHEEHGEGLCLLQAAKRKEDSDLESTVARMWREIEALKQKGDEDAREIQKLRKSVDEFEFPPRKLRRSLAALVRQTTTSTQCFNTDNGAKDPDDFGCEDGYDPFPEWCHHGGMVDDDFDPKEMCCVCGGGVDSTTTTTTMKTLAERVEALEAKIEDSGVSKFHVDGNTLVLKDMSLHVYSSDDTAKGLGNLVVGKGHSWENSTNGVIVGLANKVAGTDNFVAGYMNVADEGAKHSSILGGQLNKVTAEIGTVIGGHDNAAGFGDVQPKDY